MGSMLSCFQVPDHEDQRVDGSEHRDSDDQNWLANNLFRKYAGVFSSRKVQALHSSDHGGSDEQDIGLFLNDVNVKAPSEILSDKREPECSCDLSEDEDVCPICLEEYTDENPRKALQCSHNFHLGCIYDWLERSEACPFCGRMMLFEETSF